MVIRCVLWLSPDVCEGASFGVSVSLCWDWPPMDDMFCFLWMPFLALSHSPGCWGAKACNSMLHAFARQLALRNNGIVIGKQLKVVCTHNFDISERPELRWAGEWYWWPLWLKPVLEPLTNGLFKTHPPPFCIMLLLRQSFGITLNYI